MPKQLFIFLLLLAFSLACVSGGDTANNGGTGSTETSTTTSAAVTEDSGTEDTGTTDSGTEDSGTEDSGTEDTGTTDSGTEDSGTEDSGTEDSGTEDSGTEDTGTTDSGTEDSGIEDSGTEDSGTEDSGATDSGSTALDSTYFVAEGGQYLHYDQLGNVIPPPERTEELWGQDARYTINPKVLVKLDAAGARLPVSATGWELVLDENTDLYWEVKTNGGDRPGSATFTSEKAAEDHLAGLNNLRFGGFDDWRLPSPRELLSLLHLAAEPPKISRAYFPNTASGRYWTNKPYLGPAVSYPDGQWHVQFSSGELDYRTHAGTLGYVRAVRGPVLDSFFQDNGDYTFTDLHTGLIWGFDSTAASYSWSEGLRHCATLDLGGKNDWRMPTIWELQTLASYTSPTVTAALPGGLEETIYWSSTTREDLPSVSWNLDFATGAMSYSTPKGAPAALVAVRGGYRFKYLLDFSVQANRHTISFSGVDDESFAISTNASWLETAPSSGTFVGDSTTITLTANRSALTPGRHSAIIDFEIGLSSTPWVATINSVELVPLVGSVYYRYTRTPVAGARVSQGGETYTTGNDGAFTLYDVPLGEVTITVTATNFEPLREQVQVEAANQLHEFFLTSSYHTKSVSGLIKDRGGDPIFGVTIEALYPETEQPTSLRDTSDLDGNYRLSDLPPGQWRLAYQHPNFENSSRLITIYDQNLNLDLTVMSSELLPAPDNFTAEIPSLYQANIDGERQVVLHWDEVRTPNLEYYYLRRIDPFNESLEIYRTILENTFTDVIKYYGQYQYELFSMDNNNTIIDSRLSTATLFNSRFIDLGDGSIADTWPVMDPWGDDRGANPDYVAYTVDNTEPDPFTPSFQKIWPQDANIAATIGWTDDGYMTLPEAKTFIDYLNQTKYLGQSDWRLPAAVVLQDFLRIKNFSGNQKSGLEGPDLPGPFNNMEVAKYWSNTRHTLDSTQYYAIFTQNANYTLDSIDTLNQVLPVRGDRHRP